MRAAPCAARREPFTGSTDAACPFPPPVPACRARPRGRRRDGGARRDPGRGEGCLLGGRFRQARRDGRRMARRRGPHRQRPLEARALLRHLLLCADDPRQGRRHRRDRQADGAGRCVGGGKARFARRTRRQGIRALPRGMAEARQRLRRRARGRRHAGLPRCVVGYPALSRLGPRARGARAAMVRAGPGNPARRRRLSRVRRHAGRCAGIPSALRQPRFRGGAAQPGALGRQPGHDGGGGPQVRRGGRVARRGRRRICALLLVGRDRRIPTGGHRRHQGRLEEDPRRLPRHRRGLSGAAQPQPLRLVRLHRAGQADHPASC